MQLTVTALFRACETCSTYFHFILKLISVPSFDINRFAFFSVKQNLNLEYSPRNWHLYINKTNSSFLTPLGFLFCLFLIYIFSWCSFPIYHLVDMYPLFAWKCSYVVHFKLMSLHITLKCRSWTLSLSEKSFICTSTIPNAADNTSSCFPGLFTICKFSDGCQGSTITLSGRDAAGKAHCIFNTVHI